MSNPIPMTGRFVEPTKVVTHFHLREGDKVADFGAGSGYFTKEMSRIIGGEGKVYACEIQKDLLEKVSELVRANNLSNVEVLWCDIEASGGSKIETGVLDSGVLINTLFQLEKKSDAIKEIARTLRVGGKLLLIDWSESFSGLGPQPNDVVSESDAKSLIESGGFVFERNFDTGDHHYGLAFRKL